MLNTLKSLSPVDMQLDIALLSDSVENLQRMMEELHRESNNICTYNDEYEEREGNVESVSWQDNKF